MSLKTAGFHMHCYSRIYLLIPPLSKIYYFNLKCIHNSKEKSWSRGLVKSRLKNGRESRSRETEVGEKIAATSRHVSRGGSCPSRFLRIRRCCRAAVACRIIYYLPPRIFRLCNMPALHCIFLKRC